MHQLNRKRCRSGCHPGKLQGPVLRVMIIRRNPFQMRQRDHVIIFILKLKAVALIRMILDHISVVMQKLHLKLDRFIHANRYRIATRITHNSPILRCNHNAGR